MKTVVSKIVCLCTLFSVIIFTACKTTNLPQQVAETQVIAISANHPYTEIIPTKKDTKDMSVQVKMEFDEPNNVLIVSFTSAHNLFGFKNSSLYKNVIRDKKISVERLPYKVQSETSMTYRLSKDVRSNIAGENSKHIFKPLISTTGLHAQTSDYIMVTDTLTQKFDIVGDTTITVCLGDIMLMERSVSKKNRYDIIHYANLDKAYEIRVGRNPCLGKQEEMDSVMVMLDEITTNYTTLLEKYPPVENLNAETLLALEEVRVKLEAKYPKVDTTNECPQIQTMLENYNSYVDSIAKLADIKAEFTHKRPKLTVPADQLLAVARMVDANVSSYLVSNDVVERLDLVKRNKKLIDDINKKLSRNMRMDKEQRNALSLFKKAEKYFTETCLSNNTK